MFKNLSIYRITSGQDHGADPLQAALEAMPFTPCGATQEKSVGWVTPRGHAHAALVESFNGHQIMRFMVETRQVPGAAVKRWVDEACAAIKANAGRDPGRKERRDLADQARTELLPHVIPRQQATWVWIDRRAHRLLIDTTSPARCDDILTALVKVLDGFTAVPAQTATSPAVAMAQWLSDDGAHQDFAIGQECELKASDESHAVVRYAHHPLMTQEVRDHIAQGKQPTRLALEWNDRVSFVLTSALQIKKVTFADKALERAKTQNQREDEFDGSVYMATSEIAMLIAELFCALDGEVTRS